MGMSPMLSLGHDWTMSEEPHEYDAESRPATALMKAYSPVKLATRRFGLWLRAAGNNGNGYAKRTSLASLTLRGEHVP